MLWRLVQRFFSLLSAVLEDSFLCFKNLFLSWSFYNMFLDIFGNKTCVIWYKMFFVLIGHIHLIQIREYYQKFGIQYCLYQTWLSHSPKYLTVIRLIVSVKLSVMLLFCIEHFWDFCLFYENLTSLLLNLLFLETFQAVWFLSRLVL